MPDGTSPVFQRPSPPVRPCHGVSTTIRSQPAAISHGKLTVRVDEKPRVVQPAPFSQGQTAVEQSSNIDIEEQKSPMFNFQPGASLADIVKAVNAIGASPSDLAAILEALKQAGVPVVGFVNEGKLEIDGQAQPARVAMLPPIPKAQIPAFLAAIDVAYIGWQRVPIYRFGIAPNKLMDYMMAGCAVLHAVDAGNDPVRDADCGLTVAPEDPKAVARGLRQLAVAGAEQRAGMGRRGRAYVLTHHAYPVLAERFLDAVREGMARVRRGKGP